MGLLYQHQSSLDLSLAPAWLISFCTLCFFERGTVEFDLEVGRAN